MGKSDLPLYSIIAQISQWQRRGDCTERFTV